MVTAPKYRANATETSPLVYLYGGGGGGGGTGIWRCGCLTRSSPKHDDLFPVAIGMIAGTECGVILGRGRHTQLENDLKRAIERFIIELTTICLF